MSKTILRLIGVILLVLSCAVFATGGSLAQLDGSMRDRVIPAVVQIAIMVETNEDGKSRPEFIPVASGTVISPDGFILTNWHVVDLHEHQVRIDEWETQAASDGSDLTYQLNTDAFLILTTDGIGEPQPVFRAHIIAEQPELDLALLRIFEDADGYPIDTASLGLPFIPLGDSGQVRQGDIVHIFGYPTIGGGTLQYTSGVISGFGYQPEINGPAWIMTDASVSGGNSGGRQ